MQKKLMMTYGILIAMMMLAGVFLYQTKIAGFLNEQSENNYRQKAEILRDLFEEEETDTKEQCQNFADVYDEKYQFRITVIDKEGVVMGESRSDESQENHINREEVREALGGRTASVKRFSKTMGMDYYYISAPVHINGENGVLRISVPMTEMEQFHANLIATVGIGLFLIIAAAIILSIYFIRYIVSPIDEVTAAAEEIARGNYETKIYSDRTDQAGRLAKAFNSMAAKLRNTIHNLTSKNTELEAILSSMKNAVVAIDDMNSILFYNSGFEELTEVHKNQLVNHSLYKVLRNSAVFDVIDKVRERKTSCEQEGRLTISQERTIRIVGTPLIEKDQKNLGVLLMIEDVTSIRKLETMRTDFVSNVTHELKTPLTSIKGFVETLKDGAIQDETTARKFLNIIDIEAERLYNLIKDILLLSEIESGKDKEIVQTDIKKLAGEVTDLFKQSLHENTEFVFRADDGIEMFPCHPGRMKELLINLVDNAVKNTEKGTIELICRQEDGELCICVSDTGIGIPQEHLERIFERFYRVDKGRARKLGGTGLGLSIVKHIVEMYDGTIQVDSEEGEGTEFFIRLPYQE